MYLEFDNPPAEPLGALRAWLRDAEGIGLPNPNAMTLATVDANGRPSARIVLLKDLDERGAAFFTNYLSRKGEELQSNPRAALLFHWDALNRQVRIEGAVTQVSEAESDAYFATRPRQSQLGAWASDQSKPAPGGRAELERRYQEMEQRFGNKDVARPPHWGGYRVSLDRIEFWEGNEFRLHDRIVYERAPGGAKSWTVRRLYP